jgi:EAL domain-containing protein (putative c-di-GMP-specific phosphodiesterase class I)
VKIDGRFVRRIATSPVDQTIVKAMNEIAHALGKQTIAEFVEDEVTMNLLRAYGIDYAQGYYLGRPDVVMPCKAIGDHASRSLCLVSSAK